MIEIIIKNMDYRVKGTDIAGRSLQPKFAALDALEAARFDLSEQIVVRSNAQHERITEMHGTTLGQQIENRRMLKHEYAKMGRPRLHDASEEDITLARRIDGWMFTKRVKNR
jgi:hypothetical protein